MTRPAFDTIPHDRLPDLLRAMPKAELHMHIEGSLEPELIFALACGLALGVVRQPPIDPATGRRVGVSAGEVGHGVGRPPRLASPRRSLPA